MRLRGLDFNGHVSVNHRIYEIQILNAWDEEEKIYINGKLYEYFPHKDQVRRSICIENTYLHFSLEDGQVSVKQEEAEKSFCSPEEKTNIPIFHGISKIEGGSNYLFPPDSEETRLKHNFLQIGLAIVIFGGFLIALILGPVYLELILSISTIVSVLIGIVYQIYKVRRDYDPDWKE